MNTSHCQSSQSVQQNAKSLLDDCKKICASVRKLAIFPAPESVFMHCFQHRQVAFWLDSSCIETGLSRFSFMGTNSGPLSQVISYTLQEKTLTVQKADGEKMYAESIFEYLDRTIDAWKIEFSDVPFDFLGGFVGYFGYELKGEEGTSMYHQSPHADAMFLFVDQFLVFDHQEQEIYLVCLSDDQTNAVAQRWFDEMEVKLRRCTDAIDTQPLLSPQERMSLSFSLARSHKDYMNDIRICKKYLRDGDSYEICLTNTIETHADVDGFELYRVLRQRNPAPYAAYLRFGETQILCSSPERFLRIDRERFVETKPIKGTCPRGKTPGEDVILRERLRTDEKNRAENMMIVDLLRNDLGRVCEIGSVHVPKLMEIESYTHIHHLVSTIKGKLQKGKSSIDCVRAAFPGGSMTGAPKGRTMQILETLEGKARGIYSGSIGYLSLNGTADLNIVIRTIVMNGNALTIGVGGAIVIQSDEEQEFDEMLLKGKALMEAILTMVSKENDTQQYDILNGRP